MAPHGQAAAGEAVAVCGGGVEGEGEGLFGGGIAEVVGDGGPEYILVIEVRAYGEVFGGAVGIAAAGVDEGGRAAQREPSVPDTAVEVGTAAQAAAVARPLPPRHVLSDERQVVDWAPHPRGGDTVIPPLGPCGHLVTEDPSVGMADEDIVPRLGETVETLREHHGVVSGDAVARAEPLLTHTHYLGLGRKGRVWRHVETLGGDEGHVVGRELPHVVGDGAALPVGGEGSVDGYEYADFHHWGRWRASAVDTVAGGICCVLAAIVAVKLLLFLFEYVAQLVDHIFGQQDPRGAAQGIACNVLHSVSESALEETPLLPHEAYEIALADAFVSVDLALWHRHGEHGQAVAPLAVQAFHRADPLARIPACGEVLDEDLVADVVAVAARHGKRKVYVVPVEPREGLLVEEGLAPDLAPHEQTHAVECHHGREIDAVGVFVDGVVAAAHILHIVCSQVAAAVVPAGEVLELEDAAGEAYDAAVGLGEFGGYDLPPPFGLELDILMHETQHIVSGGCGAAVEDLAEAVAIDAVVVGDELVRAAARGGNILLESSGGSRIDRAADNGEHLSCFGF